MRGGINGDAPSNYVAGLGRGATGFTTRSDIGPARSDDHGIGLLLSKEVATPLGRVLCQWDSA